MVRGSDVRSPWFVLPTRVDTFGPWVVSGHTIITVFAFHARSEEKRVKSFWHYKILDMTSRVPFTLLWLVGWSRDWREPPDLVPLPLCNTTPRKGRLTCQACGSFSLFCVCWYLDPSSRVPVTLRSDLQQSLLKILHSNPNRNFLPPLGFSLRWCLQVSIHRILRRKPATCVVGLGSWTSSLLSLRFLLLGNTSVSSELFVWVVSCRSTLYSKTRPLLSSAGGVLLEFYP